MKNQNSNENIGKRIASLRKRLHLTQAQLAEDIGCTSKHLSELERGITGVSIDIQVALSQRLNCSLDYLIKGQDFFSVDSYLPAAITETLKSNNEHEKSILIKYLELYEELRLK